MFISRKMRLLGMMIFLLAAFQLRAEITFTPANPVVEIEEEITLSVSGTVGEVKWSATYGWIDGTGTTVTYIAPSQPGIDVVTVLDVESNVATIRIQIISGEQEQQSGKRAAIIITGGPNTPRNELWDTATSISNHIYKMLIGRGFVNKEIYYLSPQDWADFNGDGFNDRIVDAPRPQRQLIIEDVRKALDWAKEQGKLDQPLYLFYIGHGGEGKLHLANFVDLEAAELKALLDDYQLVTGNQVVIILDAVHSGSFLPPLAAENRAVLTSSKAEELSYFYEKQGWSRFLASSLFKGMHFLDAFNSATHDQEQMLWRNLPGFQEQGRTQTPGFDDNGDGVYDAADGQWLKQLKINGDIIVEDTTLSLEPITLSSSLQAGQALSLRTNIQGPVKQAWVEIKPLDINFQKAQQLPLSLEGEQWTVTWNDAYFNGDYQITFYAKNYQEQIFNSTESIIIKVVDGLAPPQERLAIVIAGGGNHKTNSLWDDTESISNYIYNMLRARNFTDKEIYYLSPEPDADYDGDGNQDGVVDTPSSGRNLTVADINVAIGWAETHGSIGQPLYIFFTGHGSAAQNGRLSLGKFEYIKIHEFKNLLEKYQMSTGNPVVLFIDACYSGVWAEQLKASNRAIISSSQPNELAYFQEKQSFNRFLANYLLSGTTLYEAFEIAREKQKQMLGRLERMTADGELTSLYDQNPIFGVNDDSEWIKGIRMGDNIEKAPILIEIQNTTPVEHLTVNQPLKLQANYDSENGTVKEVWALIRPPKMDLVIDTNGTPILAFQRLDLSYEGGTSWGGTWQDGVYNGEYEITFYGKDDNNVIANSESFIITMSGGIEPPSRASIKIDLDKNSYSLGETFQAKITEDLGWGYDLYAAVVIPDGSFFALKELNEFAPVNQAQTWLQPRIQGKATTIIDLTLPEGLPVGRYCIYGILSPQKEDVFETLEKGLWVMNQKCFEVF